MGTVRLLVVSVLAIELVACRGDRRGEAADASGSARVASASASAGQTSAPAPASSTIGMARMTSDHTLLLDLSTHDDRVGGRVDAQFIYKKDHPKYPEILAHVGPMKPGESKPVKPWP
jgi:uncharacterized OB-fold protein